MNRRRDPREDARAQLVTARLLAAAIGLAILVVVLLARRLGFMG
jgi:hypothetical protein